jgi:hypothetical protein
LDLRLSFANSRAQGDHVRFRVEDVFTLQQDFTCDRFDLGQVVQAVEAAQQG